MVGLVQQKELQPPADVHLSQRRVNPNPASLLVRERADPGDEARPCASQPPERLVQRKAAPRRPLRILLRSLKERRKVIRQNPGASLIDIGDGVACLEFHTKMNSIDASVLQMMHESLDEVSRNHAGLVIANEGESFSAGANLFEVLTAAKSGQWDAIDQAIRSFQNANMRLRYSVRPVVAAPHQRALGGGCEILVHCDQVHAAAELYAGFVEAGVGLIPAAV